MLYFQVRSGPKLRFQEAETLWLPGDDLLEVAGRDFGVLVVLSKLVGFHANVLDESLQSPCDELGSWLLDLAYFFVCLHDFLNTIERQFFAIALFHF